MYNLPHTVDNSYNWFSSPGLGLREAIQKLRRQALSGSHRSALHLCPDAFLPHLSPGFIIYYLPQAHSNNSQSANSQSHSHSCYFVQSQVFGHIWCHQCGKYISSMERNLIRNSLTTWKERAQKKEKAKILNNIVHYREKESLFHFTVLGLHWFSGLEDPYPDAKTLS